MPPIGGGRSGLTLTDGSRPDAERDGLIALGDDLVRKGPKWHAALGAVDPAERATALDLLGFDHQVVYSSLCAPLFDIPDPALRYAAYRAHNRAVAGFCSADERLLGVGMVDLDDLDRALPELDAALDLGLREIWIPARAPGGPRARPRRPRPVLGPPRRTGRAVRAPRRQRRARHRRRLARQRAPGRRGDDRRRDHRVQGLRRRLPVGRAVPRRARARRRARALPHAARRRHRDGRRVGAGDAAPARPRRRHLEAVGATARDVPPHAVRAGARPAALHAVPVRGRRLDVRPVRPLAVPVLVGLPARRGRPRPARPLRPVARLALDPTTVAAFYADNASGWLRLP